MTEHQEIESYPLDASPYGKTFGYWTQLWWNWIVSITPTLNPLFDKTGDNWIINQPTSDVFFLAGTLGTENPVANFPVRKINMPKGRSILFPVLNCEVNSIECPELITVSDLLNHINNDIDSIVKKECIINGKRLEPERVASDPQIFRLNLPLHNVFGVKGGIEVDSVADGYWIFTKPLPIGLYEVRFEGSCEFGRLSSGAKYNIKII